MTIPWQTTSAGQLTLFDLVERRAHAHLLLGERLPAGEGEAGVSREERGEQLRRFGLHIGEAAIRPVPRVGLHQARVLVRLQADALRDDGGRFLRAQQRAAPQRGEAVLGRPLGQFGGLRASGVVERHRQLALKAALVVVGRPSVPGEVDAGAGRAGQERSKRSRFMTLSQAATKSRTNFSPASSHA